MTVDVLVLPGFQGSTVLLDEFVRAAPSWARPIPMELPVEPLHSYDSIFARTIDSVRIRKTSIIVAESFSGPLAVLLARELGADVSLLVLANTFVRFPFRRLRALLPWAALGRIGRAEMAVRWMLAGGDANWTKRLSIEANAVSRAVFDARVSAVVHADVAREFSELTCRLMILVGTEDRLIRFSSARTMRELRPDAVVEMIEAPHLVLQTAPAEAWRRISENMESASGRARETPRRSA